MLVDYHLNWLNWFHLLILEVGLPVILIDYMIFLSPFQVVIRMPMLEMSTIKTTRLVVHRNNTCIPLVSSLFLVSCSFCCAQLWQPSCSVLFV